MDALEMELTGNCSYGTTAETDMFSRSTNLFYKHYKSITAKFITTLTTILPINVKAVKSNHDTRDSTNTIYNEEIPPKTNRARSWKKRWLDFRIKIKQFKSAVKKNFQYFKGIIIKKILNSDPTSNVDRAADLKEDAGVTSEAKVGQKDTDWFREQFEKWAGPAPPLASEETVKERLREQARAKCVKAAENYKHVPQPEPISVTALAWPHPKGVIKCLCPSVECVCDENKLQKRQKLPGSEWLWLKAYICKPFLRNRPPAEEALPRLLDPIYAEMQKGQYLQYDRDTYATLRPRDPQICFEGCRNFYYHEGSGSINEKPSTVSKKASQELNTVHNYDDWSPNPGQKQEKMLGSDRVSSDDDKKRAVSTQMVRGRSGEILVDQPYIVKYGQSDRPTTTILKDLFGVRLNVTLVTEANGQNMAEGPDGKI